MTDYPAAHSMHTSWFVVDADGQLALFETGAMGHAPEGVQNDISQELGDLVGKPIDTDSNERSAVRCEKLGLYYYRYSQAYHPVAPYTRAVVPTAPLHIDQLPPYLRDRARAIRLPGLVFSETEQIQPMEFFRCDHRYREERIAYLCSDGVTVKPIPGREGDFAAFVQQFRQQQPEAAAGLIFDGPGQGDADDER